MALEFELSLQTSFTPEEITDLVIKETNFVKSHKGKDDGDFYTLGFICWVGLIDKNSQDIILEKYNVQTNLSLWFRHDYDNYKEGLKNILKAVIIILQNTNGDAVFEDVSGYIKLIRVNGKITLCSSAFFEDEEAMWRFKDIPFEYEVKDLNID
jgi:hypothetical protein